MRHRNHIDDMEWSLRGIVNFLVPRPGELGGLVIVAPGSAWSEEAEDNVVPDVAIIFPDRLQFRLRKCV